MSSLVTLDWVVIGGYFIAVFGLAFWAVRRERTTRTTSSGYFLAGRNVGWFVIGASLFASNIGSEHLIGLAGAGADQGVAVAHYEIWASMVLILLGWVFAPFYLKSGVFTMPEFLERRYSPAARWYLAVISIVAYVLTKISVTVLAGGIIFKTLMGFESVWTGALIVIIATGIYTIFGGLRAVLYTDMLQMVILIGGAVVVTFIGLHELGGWSEMTRIAEPKFLSMWRPSGDVDYPWTGMMIGAPILGVWYWCTDQYIVQRVLSARNIDNARVGTMFGGYLKLLPLFIFVVPGIIAHCLKQQGTLDYGETNAALPALIGALLPAGIRGLVTAGFLAALMSSLSTVFNSCSTIVTCDIYKKIDPKASERRLVIVGQLSTVVLVFLGMLWVPMMDNIDDRLFQYLQAVQAYVAPPITAVFLLGLFLPRLNGIGAMVALITGFVLGAGRFILEIVKNRMNVADKDAAAQAFSAKYGSFLGEAVNMHFLHFAVLMFFVCSMLLIVFSLLTPGKRREELVGLTFLTARPSSTETDERLRVDAKLLGKHIVLTLILIGAVCSIWWYFS